LGRSSRAVNDSLRTLLGWLKGHTRPGLGAGRVMAFSSGQGPRQSVRLIGTGSI
jgi:hypothetical protein